MTSLPLTARREMNTVPLTLYARREMTDDPYMREVPDGYMPAPIPDDVVLYHDPECTQMAARIPWHHSSKPTRRNKWQMYNCARYRLVWIENASP